MQMIMPQGWPLPNGPKNTSWPATAPECRAVHIRLRKVTTDSRLQPSKWKTVLTTFSDSAPFQRKFAYGNTDLEVNFFGIRHREPRPARR